MKWEVYWQTTYTKIWKICGIFETFALASEHVDYLIQQLPDRKKQKYRITGVLNSSCKSDHEYITA